MKLYHTTWRTNETHTVHGQQRLHLRAFKGNYTIHAIQNGQIINSENFTLDHSGQTIEIHLNGSGKYLSINDILVSQSRLSQAIMAWR